MTKTIFELLTLVDITATGVVRNNGNNDLERNQQRNFETVIQILSLRTQPHIIKPPELCNRMYFHKFGDMYLEEQHKVWSLPFTADYPQAYANEISPVGNLLKDFEEIPIITGLTETACFMLPIFYPYGAIKNIHLIVWPEK